MECIETFEIEGFTANVYADDSHGNPWEEEDGHIDPEYFHREADVPRGYTIMSTHGRGCWAYDTRAAILKASRERWGLSPSSREYQAIRVKPGHTKPTRSQVRMAAIRADAWRMAQYINGDWCYVGVSVVRTGETDSYAHAVWGIESDAGEYLHEVAIEIAGEIE